MALIKNLTPLFILGIPRSGTTLLLSLLDGHPQILAGVGESRFFNRFQRRAKGKNGTEKIALAQTDLLYLFDAQNAYYKKYLSHISAESIQQKYLELISKTPMQDKDFLEIYFQSIGQVMGTLSAQTKYWVEKTPGNEFFLSKISNWWANARYIHMVRDPRDVYASYITRDRKNNRKISSVDGFAFIWSKSVNLLRRYQAMLGKENYRHLRYEDLIADAPSNLAELSGFLNIEYRKSLLTPTKGGGENIWGGNAASGEKQFAIHGSGVGKWKEILSGDQTRDIESLLFEEMKWLGYDLVNSESQLSPIFKYLVKNTLREIKFNYINRYIYGS